MFHTERKATLIYVCKELQDPDGKRRKKKKKEEETTPDIMIRLSSEALCGVDQP